MGHSLLVLAVFLTSCPVSNSFRPPMYVWPLGDKTCTSETQNQQEAMHNNATTCSLLGDVHPDLQYRSLLITGKASSQLDLNVEVLGKKGEDDEYDFAFSVFFKAHSTGGTLLDYIGSTCYRCITGITVTILKSGQLKFKLSSGYGDVSTAKSNRPIKKGAWVYLALGFDKSKRMDNLRLTLNEVKYKLKLSTEIPCKYLGLPGVLRLGSALDGSGAFRGEVTCVSIWKHEKSPMYSDSTTVCRPPYPYVEHERLKTSSEAPHLSASSLPPSAPLPASQYEILSSGATQLNTTPSNFLTGSASAGLDTKSMTSSRNELSFTSEVPLSLTEVLISSGNTEAPFSPSGSSVMSIVSASLSAILSSSEKTGTSPSSNEPGFTSDVSASLSTTILSSREETGTPSMTTPMLAPTHQLTSVVELAWGASPGVFDPSYTTPSRPAHAAVVPLSAQSTHEYPLSTTTPGQNGEGTAGLPSVPSESPTSLCTCRCQQNQWLDVMQEVDQRVSSIVRELTVNKTRLSKQRRKLCSEPDKRKSSLAMAAVAVSVIGVVGCFVLAMDLPRLVVALKGAVGANVI